MKEITEHRYQRQKEVEQVVNNVLLPLQHKMIRGSEIIYDDTMTFIPFCEKGYLAIFNRYNESIVFPLDSKEIQVKCANRETLDICREIAKRIEKELQTEVTLIKLFSDVEQK